jgi:nucleosome binding factor SPN SPT16 subunit
MKTINDDPKSFFEDAGGWSFLDPQESEVGADSEESDGFEMEEESGEESSESDSDMSSAVSENSDDSGSDSGDDEEESGEDWDELERKAKMADERKEKR